MTTLIITDTKKERKKKKKYNKYYYIYRSRSSTRSHSTLESRNVHHGNTSSFCLKNPRLAKNIITIKIAKNRFTITIMTNTVVRARTVLQGITCSFRSTKMKAPPRDAMISPLFRCPQQFQMDVISSVYYDLVAYTQFRLGQ